MKKQIVARMVSVVILAITAASCLAQEDWEYWMDFEKPKNALEQKAWDLVKECRHQGSEGARRLMAEMSRMPHKYRNKALSVLSRIPCQEARDYLLSLALSASDTYAAIVYLENNWELAGARKLLALEDMSLLVIKHFTKHKIPSDADILEATARLLQSADLKVRANGAYYLETDTSTNSARQKAEMLVQSLQSLECIPAFTNRIRMAFDVIHVWTEGGHACRGLINALANSGGVSFELLRELTPVEPGLARDCVLVARSWMKDASVKPELYRIIRDQPVGLVRFHAVNSFMRNGALADVPELEWVATHDPLFGERQGSNHSLKGRGQTIVLTIFGWVENLGQCHAICEWSFAGPSTTS